MRSLNSLFCLLLFAIFSGCATLFPEPVNIGDTESIVIAKRGQPTNRYQDDRSTLLEYNLGPWGQRTYIARLDASGKVVSFEQVLSVQKFATIKVGMANKNDVLRMIGAPSETSYLSLREMEVWSYPYKENNVWNSVMHIHFDRSGIVRQMLNGPDLRFDPDRKFPFGRSRM